MAESNVQVPVSQCDAVNDGMEGVRCHGDAGHKELHWADVSGDGDVTEWGDNDELWDEIDRLRALLSPPPPPPPAEPRDHDHASPVDCMTWVQRNHGWQHVDVLDREVRLRRSRLHGLMVGVDGHWVYIGNDQGRMRDYLNEQPAPTDAPPSIADMVPYTEFTADTLTKPVRWRIEPDGWCSRIVNGGRSYYPEPEFDPSTIRDVTPPSVTP